MKKLRQMYRCMEEWKYRNGKTTGCPTKTLGHDRRFGFTLVELVIVIAIVIILSVISVPIYRGYVDKAKYAEGYALLGQILSAQKAYYSEHGNFLHSYDTIKEGGSNRWTCNDEVLGIDTRGNKYFTWFYPGNTSDVKIALQAAVIKPTELQGNGKNVLVLEYNITKKPNFVEVHW